MRRNCRLSEHGYIRAERHFNDQLSRMVGVVVVLNEPLAHFRRGGAHHRIEIHIVAGIAPKGLNANGAFFQLAGVAEQRLLNGVGKQHRVALAVREQGVSEQPLQLLADGNGMGRIT